MRLITWLLTTALAVAAAAWLVPGIYFDGASSGTAELSDKALPLLGVSIILGLVSLFVGPLLKVLSLPLIVLTLGLFLWVINALMLMLTGAVAGAFDLGFHVDGFFAALIGALIITVVNAMTDVLLPDND